MTCRFNSRTASVDGNSFCPVCLFFCLANWLWSLATCIFNSVTSVPSEISSCLRSRGLALTVWELALCLCALAKCLFSSKKKKYDHITPILQSLHWLPIKFRISYKILLLPYKALNDLAPAYLTNLLSRYNPTRSLRSQNSGLLVVPRIAKSTKGGRTFSYLAPKLWNSLPDNVRGSDTLSLFKSRLKMHLFSQAFI